MRWYSVFRNIGILFVLNVIRCSACEYSFNLTVFNLLPYGLIRMRTSLKWFERQAPLHLRSMSSSSVAAAAVTVTETLSKGAKRYGNCFRTHRIVSYVKLKCFSANLFWHWNLVFVTGFIISQRSLTDTLNILRFSCQENWEPALCNAPLCICITRHYLCSELTRETGF